MKDVGIFYGPLVYIFYGYLLCIFSLLLFCTKKNQATLLKNAFFMTTIIMIITLVFKKKRHFLSKVVDNRRKSLAPSVHSFWLRKKMQKDDRNRSAGFSLAFLHAIKRKERGSHKRWG
jgi:hypothetical protein